MATTAILPEVQKSIRYDRATKDYACYISIDGDAEQYIGSAANYSAAETLCNDYAFSYYEDNSTPEKAAQIALADEPIAAYPQRVDDGDGMLDSDALERLGLAEQAEQVIIDERREDDMLLCLTGAGEFLIRAPGKDMYVLDFKTTAALIIFMDGGNTKKLFPAILRAALLARGGKVAELTRWIDEVFAQKEHEALVTARSHSAQRPLSCIAETRRAVSEPVRNATQ